MQWSTPLRVVSPNESPRVTRKGRTEERVSATEEVPRGGWEAGRSDRPESDVWEVVGRVVQVTLSSPRSGRQVMVVSYRSGKER